MIIKVDYNTSYLLTMKDGIQFLELLSKSKTYRMGYEKPTVIEDFDRDITISFITDEQIKEIKLQSSLSS